MFKSVTEKIVVTVLTAMIVATVYWAWEQASTASREIFIPQGAVLAFRTDCPQHGWEPYAKAEGRFIMGRPSNFGLEEMGGKSTIPSDGEHNHAVQFGRNEFNGRFGNDNSDDDWSTVKNGVHNHGGENRPPFITLNYCVKI